MNISAITTLLPLLGQLNLNEIKILVTELKQLADAFDALQKEGNTRADIIALLREVADGCNALANVMDPSN